MLSMPDGRRFPNGFSPISGSVFRRRPAPQKKNNQKKKRMFLFLFGSRNTAWRFLRSSKNMFCCAGVETGERDGGGGGGGVQRWINYVRGSSTQCVLPADQTRITSCRLQASVVTKVVANTTPIKQKKEVSAHTVNVFFSLTRKCDQTHQHKKCQHNTQQHKNTLKAV